MIPERFVDYIKDSIKKNWDLPALSDYKGETMTYAETGLYIYKFHLLFDQIGVKKGDKIALVGKNSARWAVIYLAVTSYGAVIVPILPDFTPDERNVARLIRYAAKEIQVNQTAGGGVLLSPVRGVHHQSHEGAGGVLAGSLPLHAADINLFSVPNSHTLAAAGPKEIARWRSTVIIEPDILTNHELAGVGIAVDVN